MFGTDGQSVRMNAKAPFKASSLNWDMAEDDSGLPPLLNPRDIVQVAFLLEETKGDEVAELVSSPTQKLHGRSGSGGSDSRFILGQLNVQWRSAMGDRGSITTGYLTGRKR
jgi:trafficking protein particle complex subunit 13